MSNSKYNKNKNKINDDRINKYLSMMYDNLTS